MLCLNALVAVGLYVMAKAAIAAFSPGEGLVGRESLLTAAFMVACGAIALALVVWANVG